MKSYQVRWDSLHDTAGWRSRAWDFYHLIWIFFIKVLRKGNLIDIIQTRTIKTSYHIHYVLVTNWSMESSRLRASSTTLKNIPFSLLKLKGKDIVKPKPYKFSYTFFNLYPLLQRLSLSPHIELLYVCTLVRV